LQDRKRPACGKTALDQTGVTKDHPNKARRIISPVPPLITVQDPARNAPVRLGLLTRHD